MRQVALMVEAEPMADNARFGDARNAGDAGDASEPPPAFRASLQQTANIEPRAAKFEALYQAHHDYVFYFCLRRLGGSGNIGPAEDVTHEVFTTVWRRLDAMPRQPDEAKAWIYGVARNCLLHYQRSTSRRTALNIKVTASSSQATAAPDEVAIQNLDFARAWQQLSAADQEALSLAAFEDLSATQAAQVLGISASAYKFRLHSARYKLRKALNHVGG